ncbi:putative methyltransferase [Fusarium austroafricanum]|uniref:Alpha N-terminal protein methyltransferase 1 n=1 Tax=Fusarium austroafricanum TaxID=2364996 RepID=A0A8H4NYX2_9HYPO|nr:putative methyltransferase [Fusarium austroafricanum]
MVGRTQQPSPDSLVSVKDAEAYWQNVSPSVDGMLGGYPQVSKIDLQGSREFLAKLNIDAKTKGQRIPRALEGGAGIGRVTRGVLLNITEQVDVIEPIAKFTANLLDIPGVGQILNIGLQDWQPQEDIKYELIWIQWCASQLPDADLIQFFQRCITALKPEGFIVVKENLSNWGEDVFDEEDSTLNRYSSKLRSYKIQC